MLDIANTITSILGEKGEKFMKKKIVYMLLSSICLFSMMGCGIQKGSNDDMEIETEMNDIVEETNIEETGIEDKVEFNIIDIKKDEEFELAGKKIILKTKTNKDTNMENIFLNIDGEDCEVMNCETEWYEDGSYAISYNGASYIILVSYYSNDCKEFTILTYDNEDNYFKNTFGKSASINDIYVEDGQLIVQTSEILEIFGTYRGVMDYSLQDGVLTPINEYYAIENLYELTTIKDIQANEAYDLTSSQFNAAIDTLIPKGTILSLMEVNYDEKIARFLDNKGNIYGICFEQKEDDGLPLTYVGENSEYDLFEFLPYAG